MVRPRGAGFCYTEAEAEQMFAEAEELLEAGSDGLAFGFLTGDRRIDRDRTARMVELIHGFGKEAVFHRAFDCAGDPYEAMETLIGLRVDRVLTSGQEEKAVQGAYLLGKLQAKYGDRIQILAGSGVNAANAGDLMERTGLTQVHSSCKGWRRDETTTGSGYTTGLPRIPTGRLRCGERGAGEKTGGECGMKSGTVLKRYAVTTAAVIASAFLQAFAMQTFLNPVNILSSGFTGVAVLIERITSLYGIHFSTSLGMVALNVPVALFCFKHIGKKFVVFSMIQVFLASFFLRFAHFTPLFDDALLNICFGASSTAWPSSPP